MTFAQPFSEYEVLDRVGAGSMGTVFKARHKKLDRIVALKVLKPSLGRDSRYVDRLRREARIVASLNHPNIVTGYDLGQEGGYHFFVMEFIEGKSLRELLDEWGIFAEERVLDVAIQITIALDHAYERGVIHRDIKPANILIDEHNVVKLTDMGLAKGPDNLIITRDGATVGTPQYISPEQARNAQDVDVRSDLYSLGATLFHMCTGQPPFRAETMANVLCKVLEERAPSAAGINPDLSDGLNLIIRKLLSKDPERRYQVPADLLDDLRRVQRAERPAVEEGELDRGEPGEGRGHGWKFGLFALVAVIAVIAVLLATGWSGDADQAAQLADQRRGFIQQTDRELLLRPRIGGQLELLRGKRTVAAAFEVEYLDEKIRGLELQLCGAIPMLLRQEEERLQETFVALSWDRTQRDLQVRIEDLIQAKIGLTVATLPAAAGEVYDSGWRQLLADLGALRHGRQVDFERAVAEYRESLRQRLRDRLSASDFRQAAETLVKGLRGLDRVSEDVPPREQLPAEMQQYLATTRSELSRDLQGLLDRRELAHRQSFRSLLQGELARTDAWLVAGDAAAARSSFASLRQDLQRDFPRRFRPDQDPWPDAEIHLSRTAARIDAAEARQRSLALRQLVGVTYQLVLGDRFDEARSELAVGAVGREDRLLARQIGLLDQVIAVRRKLFDALLGGKTQRKLSGVRTRQGAEVPLELRRHGEGFRLQLSGRPKPIQLGLLQIRDLVAQVVGFVAGLSVDERAGLAVWYLLTDTREVARLLENGPWAGFVRDQVAPILSGLERTPPKWWAARQRHETLRKAVVAADWGGARKALGDLRDGFQTYAANNDQDLRRLDRVIAGGEAKTRLSSELRPQVLPGGQLVVGEDAQISVDYRDLSAVRFPGGLAKGWRGNRPQRRVEFTATDSTLEATTPLSFASLCVTDQALTVELEFAFAAESDAARLFFLTIHDATLGLAALRNGALAVFPVAKRLRAGKELREQVQAALRAVEQQAQHHIVVGARHRLVVEVLPRRLGGKVELRASFDGKAMPGMSVVRTSARTSAAVVLTALQPLEAYRISIQGSGR